jgi:hypothetical protein
MLLVKREEFYVDCARALVNHRRFPDHTTVIVQSSFGHQSHLIVTVSTENKIGARSAKGTNIKDEGAITCCTK